MERTKKTKYLAIIILLTIIGYTLFLMILDEEKPQQSLILNKSYCRDIENGTECIYFGDDKHFSYSEISAGNPVDDYDLCETYEYDEKNKTIQIHCEYGKEDETVKLVSFDGEELVLKFKEERTFIKK